MPRRTRVSSDKPDQRGEEHERCVKPDIWRARGVRYRRDSRSWRRSHQRVRSSWRGCRTGDRPSGRSVRRGGSARGVSSHPRRVREGWARQVRAVRPVRAADAEWRHRAAAVRHPDLFLCLSCRRAHLPAALASRHRLAARRGRPAPPPEPSGGIRPPFPARPGPAGRRYSCFRPANRSFAGTACVRGVLRDAEILWIVSASRGH